MSTQGKLFNDKWYQDRYHVMRVLEQLSIILAVHVIFVYTELYYMIQIFWVASISGLGLYEMVFSKVKYDNWLYNKTSSWLFIKKHPKGWVSLVVFIVFGVVTFILK